MVKINDKTFIKVTNKDIYDKLENWDKKATELIESNSREHKEIMLKQDKTNGKVRLATKVAGAAIGLTVILLGFLFQHIGVK